MGIEQCQKKMIYFINMFGEFKTAQKAFTILKLHSLSLIDECTDLRKQVAAVKTLMCEISPQLAQVLGGLGTVGMTEMYMIHLNI